jgi:hypothetical protein
MATVTNLAGAAKLTPLPRQQQTFGVRAMRRGASVASGAAAIRWLWRQPRARIFVPGDLVRIDQNISPPMRAMISWAETWAQIS